MLSEQIRSRRQEMGLSQKELADSAGVSRVTVNNLEQGKYANPTINTLDGIAKALGTTHKTLSNGHVRLLPKSDSEAIEVSARATLLKIRDLIDAALIGR